MHLVFNLWWLVVFGTAVEGVLGSLKTLGLFAMLAVGSAAWQEGLAGGGVGLSGVGYGLFGMLWVLSKHDPRFEGAVDRSTVEIFVGWFLLCCVLTGLGNWQVGNVAHGSGAVLGALVGVSVSREVLHKVAWRIAAVAFLAVGLAAFVHPVPLVWMGAQKEVMLEQQAYRALSGGNSREAEALYSEVIALQPGAARSFHNRGVARSRLHRWDEALADFREAARLAPANETFRRSADELSKWLDAGGK